MILFWISKINHIVKLTNGEISKAHNNNRALNGHKAVNACRLGPMIVHSTTNVGTQYTLTVLFLNVICFVVMAVSYAGINLRAGKAPF